MMVNLGEGHCEVDEVDEAAVLSEVGVVVTAGDIREEDSEVDVVTAGNTLFCAVLNVFPKRCS